MSEDKPQSIVERNIQELLARHQQAEQSRGLQDRLTDVITRFIGSMLSIYLHLMLFAMWIVINLGWLPLPKFDPTFAILATSVSMEAVFLSTFVLITQKRMTAQAEQRADLDLQIGLLAEHEITYLLILVTEIAGRLGVKESQNAALHELKQDVRPGEVLDKMEKTQQQFMHDTVTK
jgi:uncharacterized membrane protein